jgi:hypothetical protein
MQIEVDSTVAVGRQHHPDQFRQRAGLHFLHDPRPVRLDRFG